MKFHKSCKSTILAATLCLAAVLPALANIVTYEYDWVPSGTPNFSGYLLLDAASGTGVAASTAIVGWSISGGIYTSYTKSDSVFYAGAPTAFLTWGSIGGGVSEITSISPDLFFAANSGGTELDITAGSIIELGDDLSGGFYLNGITSTSTVPDVFNTAVLLLIGLAGLAGFNLSFRRASRSDNKSCRSV